MSKAKRKPINQTDQLEALAARLIARGSVVNDVGLRVDLLTAGRTLNRLIVAGALCLLEDEEAA